MLRGAHGREAQQAAAGGIPARGQGAGSFLTAEEAAWEHDLKRLKLGYEDEGRRVSKGRKHNPAEGADSGEEGALLLQLPRPLQPCQPPANSPWKLDIVRGYWRDSWLWKPRDGCLHEREPATCSLSFVRATPPQITGPRRLPYPRTATPAHPKLPPHWAAHPELRKVRRFHAQSGGPSDSS